VSEQTQNAPLKWQRQAAKSRQVRLVFCGSMKDVLEPRPELDQHRQAIWHMIDQTPNLIWLLLTKRPEQFQALLPPRWLAGDWPQNAWIGLSAGTQTGLAFRWPWLASIPAPVVFLSLEPIIGPMSFAQLPETVLDIKQAQKFLRAEYNAQEAIVHANRYAALVQAGMPGLHDVSGEIWTIIGGESGPKARPLHPSWVRTIRDEMADVGYVFFKQWGTWLPKTQVTDREMTRRVPFGALTQSGEFFPGTSTWNGTQEDPDHDRDVTVYHVGKEKAGRLLDGQEYLDHPVELYRYLGRLSSSDV
jgi:protein gp37